MTTNSLFYFAKAQEFRAKAGEAKADAAKASYAELAARRRHRLRSLPQADADAEALARRIVGME
jgi:ADP-ribose pyrophosphatase YjhB (NUDIX family)